MLLISEPTPISVTMSAAVATDAPRSRALRGMIGRIAPSPRPKSSEGPKAETAMRRSENSEGLPTGLASPARQRPNQPCLDVRVGEARVDRIACEVAKVVVR